MLFSGFDGVRRDLVEGREQAAADFLVALLAYARRTRTDWQSLRAMLSSHPLHAALLRDPLTSRSRTLVPASGGALDLVDAVAGYGRQSRTGSGKGDVISRALALGIGEALRRRDEHVRQALQQCIAAGGRACVLAPGYLHALDEMAGQPLAGLVAVESDGAAAERLKRLHGRHIDVVHERPLDWLVRAGDEIGGFDLIHTARLSDMLDDTGMVHALSGAARLLAPGGRLVVPAIGNHGLAGYMEAAMDWVMTYRDHDDMAALAEQAGLTYRLSSLGTPPLLVCEAWLPD